MATLTDELKKLAKCGSDFKSLLWNNNIFYCYLDKFMTPEKDKFFDIVFKKELEKVIANSFVLPNAEQIFREALTQTRASLSSTARDHLYNTTMNNLKLVLNSNGTFSIEITRHVVYEYNSNLQRNIEMLVFLF